MAVAVLFTTSCVKEDISSSIAGGEVEVTFTANLPELGTRAADVESYGNASAVNVVYVKVYDANSGDLLSSLTQNTGYPVVEKKATVNIALVKGMKYNIVFWAQSSTCRCYTFNDDKTISVSYAGAEANDDNRDAFYAYVNNFDPVAPAGKDQVKLYRPFAQLNAATLDKQDVINSGINFESLVCKVEVVGACTKLDLTNGTASTPTTAKFAAATIPAKSGEILPGKSEYDYLSMNYVLVNGKQLVEATYTISGARTAGGEAFELAKNTYTNVPLQSNYRTNILGKLITKSTDFYVEIKPAFDNTEYEVVAVNNTAELQDALDNAVAGTTIELQPGVNYGAVVIRPVAGAANTITDCDYLVYRNEMLRKVENLTIVGAVGAKVEAIKVQAGHIEGSTGYVVDIKNLVIDGVEFSDTHVNPPHSYAAPIFFDLSYINVDGLTVKNCKLIGNNSNMNFVYLYGSGNPSNSTFVTAAKDITIANNVVDGIARLCELRQANNVTITGNTIKNTALHGMLLPVDGGTYSGNVTIQNNTAEGIRDRFVRMAGAGNAVVVIKDNIINNYLGADEDYIKVTDGTNVTIENNTFGSVGAIDTTSVQAILDNAVAGTTIQLQPGVNYGKVYLRPVAGSPATKVVDWQGNNYRWETYSCFEDLTIVGAQGATIDAIVVEGGTYYNTTHSQAATYPVMLSLVELKNVVLDGVTFTGKGGYDPQGHGNAINLSGNNIKVDGLTFNNCVLNNSENNARLLYKTESTTHVHTYTYNGETFTFTPSLKNITITGCTLNGGYMGLELRETENVTITNNVFEVGDRNILLAVNTGCTYTGQITITGNTSKNAKERFVRADGTGDAVVVIKDNVLINYQSTDADYIKVTNANNVTIEDNILSVATAAQLEAAVEAGGKYILTNDIELTNSLAISNANFELDGNGYTISQAAECTNTHALFDITGGKASISNVTFDGIKDGAVVRTVGVEFTADNVTAQNGNHTQVQGLFRLMGKSSIKNSTFKNNTCSMVITLNYDGANNDPQVVENCVFEGNTCNGTAVLYYVKGASCTLNGNKFVGNTVNCNSNGATVYMGFTENNVVTNNLFKNNTVNEANTSSRVAGGIFFGYETVFTGNAFIGNTVTGTNAKGNDVCVSTYYTSIDLSDNYWGGYAPVEDDDYFVQHKSDERVVIVNDYLTANPFN